MEPIPERPKLEPLAPVNGGMRWQSRYHDLLDLQRREMGRQKTDDPVSEGIPDQPEAPAAGAPHIASTPPPEARVGGEYIYEARAFDGNVSGFTWYFEKCPPGMTVDRYTGKVSWTPSEGGYVEVVLCARSLYGAASRQAWTICVRKPAAVRAPLISRRFQEALRRKTISERQPFRAFRRDGYRRDGDARPRATSPPGERLRTALVPLRR